MPIHAKMQNSTQLTQIVVLSYVECLLVISLATGIQKSKYLDFNLFLFFYLLSLIKRRIKVIRLYFDQ